MITTWGYSLPELYALPDMLEVEDYETMTGRRDVPERVAAEIAAACGAIRNFCGWHVGPEELCRLNTSVTDRRVTFIGNDVLIQLPARVVTAVSSVSINNVEYTAFDADQNGLLRVFDVHGLTRYARVVVDYTAGLTDDMLAPIKELIAHRVTHALAVPAGITSEASGGVSVTYNANWINNSRATALVGDNREMLVPYKVQGVF